MVNKKRGISPLIATVLLIGFTIAIISMVFIWWGDFVKQKAIKEELKSDAERACMSYVDIDVKSAKLTGEGIRFVINNRGSQMISGFRFRIKDGSGVSSFLEKKDIEGVSQETVILTDYTGSDPEEAEVLPIVVKSSEEGSLAHTCTNQGIKIEIE